MIPLEQFGKDVLSPVNETLYNLKFYTPVYDSKKLTMVAMVVVLLSSSGTFLNLTWGSSTTSISYLREGHAV